MSANSQYNHFRRLMCRQFTFMLPTIEQTWKDGTSAVPLFAYSFTTAALKVVGKAGT
jgi:hypothetical protein